jgi:Zn-dependent M16 (insulinase) family peptidase
LHPNTPYAFVSGGDPESITDLTYEQLVDFHRTRYHPSNARFYTYGDYPLEQHLSYLDAVLSRFGSQPEVSNIDNLMTKQVGDQRRILLHCPPDPCMFKS